MKLPSFNERNPILLQESKELLGRNRSFIGASLNGTKFFGLGSFRSNYLGREIYGGIKIVKSIKKEYFCTSLANILLLDKLLLKSKEHLPLFFGAVENTFEILMEDYSQNGKIPTYAMQKYFSIPNEIKELTMINGENELLRSFLNINNSSFKMMDFDTFPWKDCYGENFSKLHIDLFCNKDIYLAT